MLGPLDLELQDIVDHFIFTGFPLPQFPYALNKLNFAPNMPYNTRLMKTSKTQTWPLGGLSRGGSAQPQENTQLGA